MSGKKRKRPLNKHKFFDRQEENVNSVTNVSRQISSETQTENKNSETVAAISNSTCEEQLLAIRILKKKSYYLVKTGNKTSFHPIITASNFAEQFLTEHKRLFENALLDMEIEHLKQKHCREEQKEIIFFRATDGQIYEVKYCENGDKQYLIGYKNPNIPPEWVPFSECSNASIGNIINLIEREYNMEIK